MKAHIHPQWRPAIYFILVPEPFDIGSVGELVIKEGDKPSETRKIELAITMERGIYGFTNRETADKFLHMANRAGMESNMAAIDISEV